jgi:protein SCO1/2
LAAILLLCAACNGGRPKPDAAQAAGLTGLPSELVLVDQNGKRVALASLVGRPALIAFVDTNCNGVCQTTTNNLHEVARELRTEQKRDIQFVLITDNPLFDGPKRLARYADDMKLESSRWKLLTGAPDNIDLVLMRFGLPPTSKVDNAMQLMNQLDYVFLVAPDGHIVSKYLGPQMVIAKVSEDTRAVLSQTRQ